MPAIPDAPRSTLALSLAFFGVLVLLLATQGAEDVAEIVVGMGLQLVVVGLLVVERRVPAALARALGLAAILLFLASVGLLRDGAGSGFGPLILLPVVWSALRGRRDELIVALVGGALVFAVPQIFIGGAAYPAVGWRAGSLLVLVGAVTGASVLHLVRQLRSSTEHATAILGSMTEGFVLTRDSQIIAVNPALCRMLDMREDEIVGARPPYPFWPEDQQGMIEQLRQDVVAAGGSEFDVTLRRGDGVRFPASVNATRADLADGSTFYVSTVRDITAQRAHEEAMRRRADELDGIAAVTRAVSHSDPDEARRTICDVAIGVTGASNAALWEADADGILRATLTHGRPEISETIGHDQPENGSRVVWRTGRPLFVAQGSGSPHVEQRILRNLVGEDGDASFYFQPIGDASGVRGVLVLCWSPVITELNSATAPLLAVLGGEAAMAIQRADLLEQLAELSRTDELTGLPNRRAWEEILDREMRVARRTGQPLSVVMLDLDFFKAYNDHHGHQGGDRLLWLAANLWRANLRDTDVLARWGGEEFGLLLPGCDANCARMLVQRLHDLPLDGVTFSAGIAEWDGACASDVLIGRSDAALYAAKHAGRNRTHVAAVSAAA